MIKKNSKPLNMSNLTITDETEKSPSQKGFDRVMMQLNWAILEWGRFYFGRGPAKVEAFRQARNMLCEAFPVEATAYEAAANEAIMGSEVTNA